MVAVRKREIEGPLTAVVASRQTDRRREIAGLLGLIGCRTRDVPSLGIFAGARRSGRVDLVVFDWRRGDEQELARARDAWTSLRFPLLVVCHAGLPGDAARALGMGASDFVTEPFNGWEFLARCDSLARSRSREGHQAPLRVGRLSIDVAGRIVKWGDVPIQVTRAELFVLAYLARRQGAVASDDEVVTEALGEAYASGSSIVRFHICHLRRKLRHTGVRIETAHGSGHCLTCAAAGWKRSSRSAAPRSLSASRIRF